MKRKLLVLFTAILFSLTLFSVTVSADIGPKPSVSISFLNMGSEECYCTLLSEHKSTGPHSVSSKKSDDEIHRAFEEYKDSDGFYFLEYVQLVSKSKKFDWGYYPPDTFKVVLYYPETKTFAASGIINKHGFFAQYRIDMKNVEVGTNNSHLQVKDLYSVPNVIISFLLRVIITILIEAGIGFAFEFRTKKQLLLIVIVNIVTQVLLNLLLYNAMLTGGGFLLMLAYIPLEILVFIIEGVIYSLNLGKLGEVYGKKVHGMLYSFLANSASFIFGVIFSVFFSVLA